MGGAASKQEPRTSIVRTARMYTMDSVRGAAFRPVRLSGCGCLDTSKLDDILCESEPSKVDMFYQKAHAYAHLSSTV